MLSRVADSLYWMSRYLERAEHTARVLDVTLQGRFDATPENIGKRWQRFFRSLGFEQPEGEELSHDALEITQEIIFSNETESSISSSIHIARENAREVRQQISSEMWEQLNRMYHRLRHASIDEIWATGTDVFLGEIKQGTHLFQGIADSTISHGEGWHFIQVGRFLERAGAIARLLGSYFNDPTLPAFGSPADASAYLEWVGLLKSCTAFEAYCKVYTIGLHSTQIAEFLLLNPDFPHSVAFCATAVRKSLDALADIADVPKNSRVNRYSGRLCASLDYTNITEILSGGLNRALYDIQFQCSEIHSAVYQKYISYPIEAALIPDR